MIVIQRNVSKKIKTPFRLFLPKGVFIFCWRLVGISLPLEKSLSLILFLFYRSWVMMSKIFKNLLILLPPPCLPA
jgi:hypothetical protein